MALAIVQHKSAVQGLGVPGTITLAATPTAGNLLLLFLHCNIAAASITVNTSKWTKDTDCLGQPGGTLQVGMTLWRYVQGGDTATVPAPWTAGSSYTAYEIYEISGVTGTWATDHEDTQQTGKDAGTPTTTLSVSHTTAHANDLCIAGAGQYNGSHNPTWNGGWNSDESSNNNANYGSQSSASQAVVSSGTAVTGTVTYGGSSQPADLLMVTLQGPVPPVNVNLTAVSAAGAAAGSGAEIDITPAAVSGAAARGVFGIQSSGNIPLSAVAAAGVAAAPGLRIDSNVTLAAVSAHGAVGALGHSVSASLAARAAVPSVGTFRAQTEPFTIFPVLGLMRNTDVPAISPMSDAPIALTLPLPPSGPVPASVAFHLVGVSARGRASTISPFRNVSVHLTAVSAAAAAEAVVAA